MKNNSLSQVVKSKSIVIPIYIYKLFPLLEIDLEIFVFLMYLYNCGEKIIFDPHKMSDELSIGVEKILNYIDVLSSKKLIKFEIIKNDKNISEEFLSIDFFYEKLSILLMDNKNNLNNSKESEDLNIFSIIEKEFGRVLSPIEYEIIKAWRENNNSDELILQALKEAIFNGVTNLRYIDRILSEWQKKGIKTVDDIEKNKKEFRKKNDKVEIFEYNWLEDDE